MKPNLHSRSFFERFLPKQPCFLCGALSHDGVWCAACDADLPYLTAAHCPICALPSANGDICGQCLQHPPQFDRTYAAFAYAFPLNKLIQAAKFSGQITLINRLADALTQQLDQMPDGLIAMPLHPLRLRERGFNQSLLLAQRIAKQLKIPLYKQSVERVRNTTPQSTLPLKERDKNMRDAFACAVDFSGQHLAIVDDVMTTGASIEALSRTLRQAGAKQISAWVVTRTLHH
ncbi:MAG: ComF family protein [Gallionellaceae bacterium]|jgi:ComF family protein